MATVEATGERVVVKVQHRHSDKGRRADLINMYRECAFVERLNQGWRGTGIKGGHLMRCRGTNARLLLGSSNPSEGETSYAVLSDGGTALQDETQRSDWSFEGALSVTRQLLFAVASLRRASWQHGDLWEGNVGVRRLEGGGMLVTLIDLDGPFAWQIDDVYRVALVLCTAWYVPSCDGGISVFNNCLLSCHNTLSLVAGWLTESETSPPDLTDRVVSHFVKGPVATASSLGDVQRAGLIRGLWHGLLQRPGVAQFIDRWHEALVYGSRRVSPEHLEQFFLDVGIPPDVEPHAMDPRVAQPIEAASKGEPLELGIEGCPRASCTFEAVRRLCEIARESPSELTCGRLSAGLRAHQSSLRCIEACQYNSDFIFGDAFEPWNSFSARYRLSTAPNISRTPLDEWLMCTDAQLQLDQEATCTDFANQFIERPGGTALWSLSPDTLDEHAWCEVDRPVELGTYWKNTTLSEYGSVPTLADCQQCCLLDESSKCSSIHFGNNSCWLLLGPPPHRAEELERSCHYLIAKSAYPALPESKKWTLWLCVLVALLAVVALGAMHCKWRRAPLVESGTSGTELAAHCQGMEVGRDQTALI